MAGEMVTVMKQLGFARFSVVGHDRGGRVAYRLALDHPQCVDCVAVFDIVPTGDAWSRADAKFVLSYWPWSLLAQPAPLPERLIGAAPEAIIDDALSGWGSPASAFPADVRNAYVDALRDPAHVHAICEEYRAAATIDRDHDEADRIADRQITSPLLILWADGAVDEWYQQLGGPLALWRRWATDVRGRKIDGGHFFPEQSPQVVTKALNDFLTR